ncbi:MAG: CapA family protein [Synergistaceae bacterium]|nr:CapA family protein [Synergistaceae bacterium]
MRKIFLLTILLLLCETFSATAETRARFLFIGDIMTHQQQLDAAIYKGKNKTLKGTYDFSPQFRRVKKLLEDSFLVGNLETTFSGTGKKLKYSGYPLFNTPDSLIDVLSDDLKIDLLTLANNHIFDRGAGGARRTVEALYSADIKWIGLGIDYVVSNDAILLENEGIKAAFINHSYGSNLWPKSYDIHLNVISEKDLKISLERAKKLSPDIIIACFHWGNEYQLKPNIHQKKAAEISFNNGADLIIGTHPHVLQPVEIKIISDDVKVVAWSLGNFVSFQRTLPRERNCILAVEVVKDDEGVTRISKVSTAPLYVIAPGQKRTEVTYAGNDEKVLASMDLDFEGLSKNQITKLHNIGKNVLDFLGTQDDIDEYGFYTLWDETSPDILPKSRRKSPK